MPSQCKEGKTGKIDPPCPIYFTIDLGFLNEYLRIQGSRLLKVDKEDKIG